MNPLIDFIYEDEIEDEIEVCAFCGSDCDDTFNYKGCCGEARSVPLFKIKNDWYLEDELKGILKGSRPLSDENENENEKQEKDYETQVDELKLKE